MTLPKVSVILPAYRQAAFISRALDSVAAQTYEGPIEPIVIDDGSPDEGAEIARAHPIDPIVISQRNQGVSFARNAGIEAATGEYIAFLDADDAWHPGKLDAQLALMRRHDPLSLSFTRYRRVDARGLPLSPLSEHPSLTLPRQPSARALLRHNFVGTSTVIAHRACFEECGLFPADDQLLKGGQDFALWLRIALRFPLLYLPEILTDYTVHATNRVGTDPLKHHAGAVHALRALWRWDEEEAKNMAGMSLNTLVIFRSLKLVKELLVRHEQVDPEVWPRLLPTLLELFKTLNTPSDM